MVRRLAHRNSSSALSETLNDCFSSAYRDSCSACVTSHQSGCVITTSVRAMTQQTVLHFLQVRSGSGIPITESTLSTTQVPSGLTEGFLGQRCDFPEDVVTVVVPSGNDKGEGSEG